MRLIVRSKIQEKKEEGEKEGKKKRREYLSFRRKSSTYIAIDNYFYVI